MNGIYFLANDRVKDWFIAAVESVRARGATLPICVIPYDDNTLQIRALVIKYGLTFWEDASRAALDEIGATFVLNKLEYNHMFRKFACFWGPYEDFMYSDVDVIALMNWDELVTQFHASDAALWYFDLSEDFVYKPGPLLEQFQRQGKGMRFNGGGFVSSKGEFDLAQVRFLAAQAQAYRLQFAGMDQAFLNYCIDATDRNAVNAADRVPNLHSWSWAPATYKGHSDIYEIADREGTFQGKRFPMIHWAGFELRSYMPHRELWLKYRLRNAPWLDKLNYGWAWRVRPIFGNVKRALQKNLSPESPIGI